MQRDDWEKWQRWQNCGPRPRNQHLRVEHGRCYWSDIFSVGELWVPMWYKSWSDPSVHTHRMQSFQLSITLYYSLYTIVVRLLAQKKLSASILLPHTPAPAYYCLKWEGIIGRCLPAVSVRLPWHWSLLPQPPVPPLPLHLIATTRHNTVLCSIYRALSLSLTLTHTHTGVIWGSLSHNHNVMEGKLKTVNLN